MDHYQTTANELAREIIELNPEMAEGELAEAYQEQIHEIADNAVIYYSNAAEIVSRACSTYINDAEDWLAQLYGESVYLDCPTFGDVQCRLAYALVYRSLDDAGGKALEDAWEWRNTYGYRVNIDERGEYSADVVDFAGEEIFSIQSAEEMSEMIESGYMGRRGDLDGLLDRLQQTGLLSCDAMLVRDSKRKALAAA